MLVTQPQTIQHRGNQHIIFSDSYCKKMAEGSAICPIDLTDDDSWDDNNGMSKRVGEEMSSGTGEDSFKQTSAKRTKKDEGTDFEGITGEIDSVDGTLFSTVSEQILEFFSENVDAEGRLIKHENQQEGQNQELNKPDYGAVENTAQTSVTSEESMSVGSQVSLQPQEERFTEDQPEFIDIDQLLAGPSSQRKFGSWGLVSQPNSDKKSDFENVQEPVEEQINEKIENVQEPIEEQTNEKIKNFQEHMEEQTNEKIEKFQQHMEEPTNEKIENFQEPLKEQINEKIENDQQPVEELNNEKKVEITVPATATSEEQHVKKHGELENISLPSVDSNAATSSFESQLHVQN